MSAAITEVGARLVLDPGNFAATADGAVEKLDAITAAAERAAGALARTGEAAAAAGAETTKAAAGSAAAAGGSADAEAMAAGVVAGEEVKRKAIRDTEDAAKKQASTLESLASNNAIKKLAEFGTATIAISAYESVKSYAKFNQLVTQSAVDAGLPASQLAQVQKALLQDTRQTGVAADDMANSFYRVQSAMAGSHAKLKDIKKDLPDILKMVSDTAKLDVLWNVPAGNQTEQTARIMGALMNAGLKGGKTPDEIMALANSAVGRGDIRGADLISAIGKMLPAAKIEGAHLPDLLGWLDTLTKLGMQGSQAGTLINHSLQQLVTPSEQGQKAEQMAGIDPSTLGKMVTNQGIPAAIKYLQSSLKAFNPTSYYPSFAGNAAGAASAQAQLTAWGILDPKNLAAYESTTGLTGLSQKDFSKIESYTQQHSVEVAMLTKIFGGAKSASPMLALMADPDKYQALVNSISAGATPQALAESMRLAMNTPARQMQIAKQNLEVTGMQLGQDLTPAATEFLRILGQTAKLLGEHPNVLMGLAAAVGGLVSAAVAIEGIHFVAGIFTAIGKLGRMLGLGGGVVGDTAIETAAGTMETAAGTMMTAAETMMAAADRGALGGAASAAESAAKAGAEDAASAAAGTGEAAAAGAAADFGYGTLVGPAAAAAGGGAAEGAAGVASGTALGAAAGAGGAFAAIAGLAYLAAKQSPSIQNSKAAQMAAAQKYLAAHPLNFKTEAFEPADYRSKAQKAFQKHQEDLARVTGGGGRALGLAGDMYHPAVQAAIQHLLPDQHLIDQGHRQAKLAVETVAANRYAGANLRANNSYNDTQRNTDAQQGYSQLKDAGQQLGIAAKDHNAAALDQLAAATETGTAAKKHEDAARKLEDAAKQHAKSAQEMSQAAQQLLNAAQQLGSVEVQISSLAAMSKLANAQATQLARA